jgi:hypothetical protein
MVERIKVLVARDKKMKKEIERLLSIIDKSQEETFTCPL